MMDKPVLPAMSTERKDRICGRFRIVVAVDKPPRTLDRRKPMVGLQWRRGLAASDFDHSKRNEWACLLRIHQVVGHAQCCVLTQLASACHRLSGQHLSCRNFRQWGTSLLDEPLDWPPTFTQLIYVRYGGLRYQLSVLHSYDSFPWRGLRGLLNRHDDSRPVRYEWRAYDHCFSIINAISRFLSSRWRNPYRILRITRRRDR